MTITASKAASHQHEKLLVRRHLRNLWCSQVDNGKCCLDARWVAGQLLGLRHKYPQKRKKDVVLNVVSMMYEGSAEDYLADRAKPECDYGRSNMGNADRFIPTEGQRVWLVHLLRVICWDANVSCTAVQPYLCQWHPHAGKNPEIGGQNLWEPEGRYGHANKAMNWRHETSLAIWLRNPASNTES